MQNNFISGILLGVTNEIEIPEELRNFLSQDDQGMNGLELMLSDSKLSKRIPPEVRTQYEVLYGNLRTNLEAEILKAFNSLKDIKSNPKGMLHDIIQNAYESK